MNADNLETPSTLQIQTSLKNPSYYASYPQKVETPKYVKRQYDLLPNNVTTSSLALDDEVSSYIKQVYANAAGGEGLNLEERFIVDTLAATVFGVDYSEVASNRERYIPMLTGATDLDDRAILEAWGNNFKSYGYQKKLANKMNEFDRSEDEEEKKILLEEMENINNEIFKLGDYNSRNAFGKGFVQSASIARQGLTTLGWTAIGLIAGAAITAATGGAGAGVGIATAAKALSLSKAAQIGKIAGLSADVILNTFATEKGSMSYELYNLTDENGNRLDDDTREVASFLGALAITAIEYISFPDAFTSKFIKGTAGKTIAKKASTNIAKEFAKNSAKGAVGESLEEAIQTLASSITEYASMEISDAKGATSFNADAKAEFERAIADAMSAFTSSMLPSFFAGAGGNIYDAARSTRSIKADRMEISSPLSFKDADKLQSVSDKTTVLGFDQINLKGTSPTGQYGTTTDANGKETKTKLDPIKVMRDPEDRSRYIPVNQDEMDKAKWLRNQRAKGLAVEIVDSNDNISADKDSWERAIAGYSGTIEGNAITFASESEMKAFDEFAKREGIGKSLNGEYLITGDDGSTLAYSATVDGTIENARAHEVLKTVEPKVSMDIKKAFDDAGAKISDRELALVSKVASSFGNLGNLTITSENDANLTAEERDELIGSRGIVSFSVSEVGNSAKIILSKDADATTVVHEMFHVALKTNKTARENLVRSFKDALKDTRDDLKAFYENHFEIVRDSNVQSVDDALTILDMMTEDNVLSDSMFQELLTKTFEAFWADNTMMEDANLSPSIKNFFKQLSELFKSIYKSLTGRDLTALPKNVEGAYMGFMGEKSEILKQEKFLAPNGKPSNLSPSQWHMVRTENFKKWFGDWENDPENASKVVDENGEPREVYHGTYGGEFDVFDIEKGNFESDMGRGFYFTSNYYDMSNNYEEGGPDFDNKIERLAEALITNDEDLDSDEAREQAREILFVGGNSFDVFLNMRNPAYVDSTRLFEFESSLDMDDFVDEDEYYDAVNEEIEQEFADAIDNAISRAQDEGINFDEDELRGILGELAYEGVGISEAKERLMVYSSADNGDFADNELLRCVIEACGFDGIIDSTVSDKFANMNIEEGTSHFIAFKPNQIKSATDNTGEFSSDNPSILHQDILDTTLLDEGAARRKFDEFTEADVVAEIDANVFIPDFLLDKYSNNPTVKKEIEDREQIMNMVSDKEKLLAVRSESIGAFISELKELYGEALTEEMERLYRKFYTYANTQTPQQMREWFRSTFSTIDKLMELKAMLSPRRVAKRQNGKVINALYVPKTSYVYSLIRDLNLNSPKEDVDKILDSIKKDTNVWVKAYIRSKADYQKFRAFDNNSREYLQSLAEIAYLSLSDAELDFLKKIRMANNDGTVAEDKKELRELRKELKAFGSIPENDETYIEASKHFYEDALEALREEIGEEAYRVALEKDRKYQAEIEKIRTNLAEKQYDAITRERWLAKKKLLEQQREADMLLISTKNAAKIRQDKIKEKYEIRIDQLKKEKNQVIEDLRIMRDLKLEEQEIYWRNSKAQAILRERNWRKISEARIKAHYDHRIKALQLRMMYREASAKLDKNIKNKLSINLKTHDAYALETIKYVANLIVRKNYQGMDSAEFERYKTRTGKEDQDDIIFEYIDVDDNGNPIVDEDGNEKMFQFHYNPGAENYSKDTIPDAMLPYLSDATISKLHSPDFAWHKLDIAEKENILDALIGVRNEAKAAMEYKHAQKVKENIDISSKMVASILKQDDPLTMEFRARIAETLGMKGTEPNFEQKAQTYFAQHIDQFITPPEKPKKYLGFVASTFGHIQSIAYALDGNKEGPIYELFVNRPQRAIDKMASAVSKRNKEASEAFEVIWESGDVSRADKMKWFGAKYEVSTNSLDGGKKKLTGWNLMGAYIYSQNVHGFVKLVSDKGNNISMEEMARINPQDTFKMIEEDLKQRKEFREHEVSRMEYHAKRGTEFVPQRYEGLLWTFSEVELVRIKGLIETGHIESMMPQFAKDMGNKMIELLSKYTDDMNKAAYELYNMPFTEQRRYFPLVGYVNTKDVSLTEFMQSKKSVSHGFIKERRMNRDYELLLDPMAVFYSAIEAQERMVHLTKVVNQMKSALSPHGGNLSKVVEERYGSKMSNYLNSQLRVLAGESAYKMADWEKMANAVLQNLAVSKIGLNFMTSLKQFGSLITAMTDGEINIADFIRQFGMDRDAKATLYETLAPDLAESSVELDIARMKKANQTTKAGTKIAQIQDFSMKLTQNIDQMVKKWVWTASYIKSVEQGMNESDAALKATALVKRTQSISSEYDLSQIQRNKNPLAKAVFMFTNDLFQMWNRLALGIPSDIKSKNYWRAFEKGLGSVMVAGFLGLAACGWLPEEEEDKFDEKSFLNDLIQNLMAFTPLVGTAMEDAVSGMRSNLTNFPTEFITLVRMPFKGSEEYELEDYVDQLYDTFIGAVGFTGLPTLTADRAMKLFFPNGIDDGFDFNAGNFAYLFVGSRAGDFFHRLADEHR